MANKARGEVSLKIKGKSIVFYLKIQDLAEIEDKGITIVQFQKQLEAGLIGSAVRSASVVLSIASHGQLSENDVCEWFEDVGLEVFMEAFNKIFELAFNGMKMSKSDKSEIKDKPAKKK